MEKVFWDDPDHIWQTVHIWHNIRPTQQQANSRPTAGQDLQLYGKGSKYWFSFNKLPNFDNICRTTYHYILDKPAWQEWTTAVVTLCLLLFRKYANSKLTQNMVFDWFFQISKDHKFCNFSDRHLHFAQIYLI